jgi:hypothetical protein
MDWSTSTGTARSRFTKSWKSFTLRLGTDGAIRAIVSWTPPSWLIWVYSSGKRWLSTSISASSRNRS